MSSLKNTAEWKTIHSAKLINISTGKSKSENKTFWMNISFFFK